jgi:hypothetical protein
MFRCKLKFMNRLTTKLLTATVATASLLSLGSLALSAQATAPSATSTATKAPKVKAPAAPPPSAADIADATSKGLVWVNLNTKVYHKPGVPTYGTTKNGKFMSEADAQAAGYKAAQEPKTKAKKSTATSTATK